MSNPVFQHRHYKEVAAILAKVKPQHESEEWSKTVSAFATHFASDNERFDANRFLAASFGEPIKGKDKVRS